MKLSRITALSLGLLAGTSALAPSLQAQTQVPILTPQESVKHFLVPKGYHMELVLSDPIIKEPVVTVFDGNGRMYVAEMRTYMQDADATDEHTPVSRVSLHVDTNGDGIYDKHTVFIDKLLLPRMIQPLDNNRIIVGETDTSDLYIYTDTNGDGVADKKELFFKGGPRGGNMEHQPSGLIWAMDNWLYTTYNSYRLRVNDGKEPLKEPTAPNGGQWGLTQDDYGKPWYVNAGGEKGPVNFQTPIVYGAFNVKDQFIGDFSEVWPATHIPDMQGGEKRIHPVENNLNHFTATCGAEVYRGDRLPADLEGDLLFAEPVGRLIRRTKIEVKDGLSYLSNPYEKEKSEFIRSTDPLFRPVNMTTAPDGTLYITDMYRGIIQEGNWVKEGTYLRGIVKQYGMDNNISHGRIWRLVHDGMKPGPQPHMLNETPAQLVKHLEHPNGWWRDTAQKLLVLKGDKSVVPALETMARTSKNPLARIQAIWTLEGLYAATPSFLREKLKDSDPQVRIAAIRASETLYKAGDKSLVNDVSKLVLDKDPNVTIQVMLTSHLLNWPNSKLMIQTNIIANPSVGVKEIGAQILIPPRTFGKEFTADEKALLKTGENIFKELCFACHGADGKGMPVEGAPGVTLAPPLAGSKTVLNYHDAIIRVVLHGLTGPVNGKMYEAQMVPMGTNPDDWIAAITSYIRNSFGNSASIITAKDVAKARAMSAGRTEPWTIDELYKSLPESIGDQKEWKLTASHNPQYAARAVDGDINTRFDTGKPQVPGMWFQIELPQATTVTGLRLDSSKSARDYPRGYKVEVSLDGKNWGKPVATGKGRAAVTEILFKPSQAKFIRITQTGSEKSLFWSIHELDVLGTQPKLVAKVAAKPANKAKFE